MNKFNFEALKCDPEVWEEITGSADVGSVINESALALTGLPSNVLETLDGGGRELAQHVEEQLEAIVLLIGRPPLVIQDGTWAKPKVSTIRARLETHRSKLEEAIPKVGRLEVLSLGDYLGTGWMIDENVLVTNRHVAEAFAVRAHSGFQFRRAVGLDEEYLKAQVDFLREYQRSAISIAEVSDILLLEAPGAGRPDMALLRLKSGDSGLPEPIELDDANPRFEDDVAVIGYPAEDSRNDAFAMAQVFDGVYNVKRLSPGKVRGVDFDGKRLIHDCTTLGGSSGSVVLNLKTGKACGLHFSGNYRVDNYAVSVGWLKARMMEFNSRRSFVISDSEERHESTPRREIEGRSGYNEEFLGTDDLKVPLPEADKELVADVKGENGGVLRYTHFSVVMHKTNRLTLFTAVNIDGELLYNFPRGTDKWFLDVRLEDHKSHQIGPELYVGNPLDRGHLVRRLDPAWGETREVAKQAEKDTFFYTNCAPQHLRLNRRSWLSLEDYILENASTHELKVSVFTGPVMAKNDRIYREVPIPEEYWKVIAIRNKFTGTLSATGYLLSQAANLTDLEFRFGEFRTFQVPIVEIEERTELSFGALRLYDPLREAEGLTHHVIATAQDIVI
jgi:endonuclease G, mitochondrial